MTNDQPSYSVAGGSEALDIVSQFSVGENLYWVVRSDCPAVRLSASQQAADCELCRFEVAGQELAIIRALGPAKAGTDVVTILTARELQIATLVALGYPNKVVAHKLHISEWTVATYLRRIFAKLGVESRAAMTYRCAPIIEKQGSEAVSTVL